MGNRTPKSSAYKFNKRGQYSAYSEKQLQAEAHKVLDGMFLNKQGRWISGHELDADEQDNVVGHVYIQMVMRLASQRAGYLDAEGNPTPKAIKAHRKMLRDMRRESSSIKK